MSPTLRARLRALVAAAALVLLTGAPAAAQQPAGAIKVISGTGFIIRGGQEIVATVGLPVYEADTLRTAADGRLGVTLKDGTRLSLGASTEVQLNTFAYSPADGRLGFAMKVLRGVTAYISGRIAALAPASVKIETPTSVIGVRGTHLLIGVDRQ